MAKRLLAVLCLLVPHAAWALPPKACAPLEGRTVHWIVPSKPGGGYDTYSRLIQPFLAEALGARVFIENRPEAGGIVAAMQLRDARADGSTLGIVNASGMLAAHLNPDRAVPDLSVDFSILARVSRNRMVLLTGRDSGIFDFSQLANLAATRPIVIGVRDAGSASFFVLPLVMDLLALDYELVTGYVGSTSRALAALRGEVDLIVQSFGSVYRFVSSGELRPLVSVSDSLSYESPDGVQRVVPVLGGAGGLAVQRSSHSGKSAGKASDQAQAVSDLIAAGRLVVAPRGLSAGMQSCLETALTTVLTSPELQAAAAREDLELDYAPADQARADLSRARDRLHEFSPLLEAYFERETD